MCKNKSFHFIFFEKGNSLNDGDGQQFSTKDRDNDGQRSMNCANKNNGAWWYKNCHRSNLNGKYLENGQTGIFWGNWKRMKRVEMKIRQSL